MKYFTTILAILSSGFELATCFEEKAKMETQQHVQNLSPSEKHQKKDVVFLQTEEDEQCVTVGSGNSVSIESCYEGSNQKWVYHDEQYINEADGKCLGVRDDGIIVATTCQGLSNTKWTLKSNGSLVTGYHKNVCMNINNNVLNTYWCNGGIDQQFKTVLDESPDSSSISSSIIIRTDDTLCIKMSVKTGNDVTLDTCTFDGSDGQGWFYDKDTKTIQNKNNGKCLDVNESDPNKSIGVWPCHGRNNQKWLDDSNRLTSLGKCMQWNWNGDLSLKNCGGSYRQRFVFLEFLLSPGEGYKPIRLSSNGSRCVDMATTKNNEKYNVSIKPCNGARNQNWFFNTQKKTMVNQENEAYCLDVDIEDGYNLITWECHERENQQWGFDNFNRIYSKLNKNCMSMSWRSGNLGLAACHSGYNQEFSYQRLTL